MYYNTVPKFINKLRKGKTSKRTGKRTNERANERANEQTNEQTSKRTDLRAKERGKRANERAKVANLGPKQANERANRISKLFYDTANSTQTTYHLNGHNNSIFESHDPSVTRPRRRKTPY